MIANPVQNVDSHLRRYQMLLELSMAIATHRSLPGLFHDLASRLKPLFDFQAIGVMLADPSRSVLRPYIMETDEPAYRRPKEEISIEDPILGEVWRRQHPIVIYDVEKDARFLSILANKQERLPMKSLCAFPLTTGRQRLGVLAAVSDQPGAYAHLDFEFMQLIAAEIAMAVENALAFREIDALKNKLAEEKLYLEEEILNERNFQEIIGQSQSLKRILQQVATVAETGSTVLIYGETGTGKELIARAVHNLSPRRERTFVKVNCAAIPTGLLESEMFGHEKGAFTGAIERRIGRFELAHQGTIFLDEVGDVPLELQSKLLRVLQEQEFERLGSSRTMRVDARVVAATNCDLAGMMAEKKFRSDLFYRLSVFPVKVPALRERPEDIPLLVHFFAGKFALQMKKSIERIPAKTMAALTAYSWPGNIRELQNLIERAMILSRGAVLDVPLSELQGAVETVSTLQPGVTLEANEREHIMRALQESDWVLGGTTGAAARLGIPRTTLSNKLRKLGIARPRD